MTDNDAPVAADAMNFDRSLRIAVAVCLPLLVFATIYSTMQARFVASDTAALREEVKALHLQINKLQRPAVGAAQLKALPSPRPTPRRTPPATEGGGDKTKAKSKTKARSAKARPSQGRRKKGAKGRSSKTR